MQQEARAGMESLLSWDECSSRTPASLLEVTIKECLHPAPLYRGLSYVAYSHQVKGGVVVNMAVLN